MKLSAQKLKQIEAQLQTLERDLETRLSSISEHLSAPANQDWAEQAQERENDEVLSEIGNEGQEELRLVKRALQRIKAGDYGFCEDCGDDILAARLSIMPYTNLCIACAEQRA